MGCFFSTEGRVRLVLTKVVMVFVCVWQHGGDVNAADHTGQTALHWSAVRGAIQVAELLLQEGARINSVDMYGYQVGFHIFFSHT